MLLRIPKEVGEEEGAGEMIRRERKKKKGRRRRRRRKETKIKISMIAKV